MSQQFVKLSKAEFEALKPKRGTFSTMDAYLDLKFLLFSCNRVATRRIEGVIVKLERWEEAISLSFFRQRWKWADETRVSRTLRKWEKEGFIKIRKIKGHQFNIISLTIVLTTNQATDNATDNATDSATPNPIDNQPIMDDIATLETTLTAIDNTIDSARDNATNIRREEIEEVKEVNTTTTTAREVVDNERKEVLPFQGQIDMLRGYLVDNEFGQNAFLIACQNRKIKSPSTKDLVEEIEKWAYKKYTSQPNVLLSYKDHHQCWGDFNLRWLPYAFKEEKKAVTARKSGNKRGKGNDYKNWNEGKFEKVKTGKAGLVEF
jgi:hypothetical protein